MMKAASIQRLLLVLALGFVVTMPSVQCAHVRGEREATGGEETTDAMATFQREARLRGLVPDDDYYFVGDDDDGGKKGYGGKKYGGYSSKKSFPKFGKYGDDDDGGKKGGYNDDDGLESNDYDDDDYYPMEDDYYMYYDDDYFMYYDDDYYMKGDGYYAAKKGGYKGGYGKKGGYGGYGGKKAYPCAKIYKGKKSSYILGAFEPAFGDTIPARDSNDDRRKLFAPAAAPIGLVEVGDGPSYYYGDDDDDDGSSYGDDDDDGSSYGDDDDDDGGFTLCEEPELPVSIPEPTPPPTPGPTSAPTSPVQLTPGQETDEADKSNDDPPETTDAPVASDPGVSGPPTKAPITQI